MWTSEHQQKNFTVDILLYDRKITGQSELCGELNPEKWSRDVETVCVFGSEELLEALQASCMLGTCATCAKTEKKEKKENKKKKNPLRPPPENLIPINKK